MNESFFCFSYYFFFLVGVDFFFFFFLLKFNYLLQAEVPVYNDLD